MSMAAIGTHAVALLATAAIVAASCGTGTGSNPNSVSIPAGDGPTTTSGGGLSPVDVVIIGELTNDTICPGGQRPCMPISGDTDGLNGTVRLNASIVRDVLEIDSIEAHEVYSKVSNFADRCEGLAAGESDLALSETLHTYAQSIPDRYATIWSSPTRVIHFGVVGDAAPHQQAMDDLGVDDKVCVVGDFLRSDAELERVEDEVGELVQESFNGPGVGLGGCGRDHYRGAVSVDLFRMDAGMRKAATDRFADTVIFNVALEVLNADLAEFDSRFGNEGPAPTAPVLQTICGAVTYDAGSVDLDAFPTPDAELTATLVAGFGLDGGFGDIPNTKWSIVSEAQGSIGVIGQQPTNPPSFVYAFVEQLGEQLRLSSWGGCTPEVTAIGFGSAVMILDPDNQPNRAASTVSVWIMERNCASGQPPEGREVVPVVTETDTEIRIAVLVAPVKGGADCPSNPWYPLEVTLEQPLGDRTILDDRTSPPIPRSWPPSDDDLNG